MNNRRLKRRSTVTFLQLLARSSVFEPPRAARSCSDRPPPPPPPPSLQHHLLQKMPRLLLQGGFGDWSSAIIWARFCQTRVKGTRHRVPARSSARGHCSRCCCCSLNIIFVSFCCYFCLFSVDRDERLSPHGAYAAALLPLAVRSRSPVTSRRKTDA